jgi:hypothetical protein
VEPSKSSQFVWPILFWLVRLALFLLHTGWMTCCPPLLKTKSNEVLFDFFQFPTTVMVEKSGFKIFFYQKTSFSTHFLPQKPRKYRRNHDKPINDLLKTKIKTKQKNFPSLNLFFWQKSKVKKKLIWTLLVKWNYLTEISIIFVT